MAMRRCGRSALVSCPGFIRWVIWEGREHVTSLELSNGAYNTYNRLSYGLAVRNLCPQSMENIEDLFLQSSSKQWGTDVVQKLKGRVLHDTTILILHIHISRNWKFGLKMYLYRVTSFTQPVVGVIQVQQQTNGQRKDGMLHTVEYWVAFKKMGIPIGSTAWMHLADIMLLQTQ